MLFGALVGVARTGDPSSRRETVLIGLALDEAPAGEEPTEAARRGIINLLTKVSMFKSKETF